MNTVIIDLREPFEYAAGHVEGALSIPPQNLMKGAKELEGLPKDTQIILYCRSGARSNVAQEILKQQGFRIVENGINKDHVEAKLRR